MFRVLAVIVLALPVAGAPPSKPSELFLGTKVWTVHLTLTPEQFDAMEPKGLPGGPRPVGARFGPAMLAVPGFLKGDTDKDGKLSEAEFKTLAEQWFAAWDKGKLGSLTQEQLRAGINASFPMPARPPGPGGPPPPGGPGRAMFEIDFPYSHADLEFDGVVLKDVAVRYKGNSTFARSRGLLKRSMKIDLNKYQKGRSFAGVTRLNLHSNVMDPGFMNEPIGYRLFREAQVPAPRTAYARVYLSVAGKHERKFVGLFSLVEEVDKNFAEERFPEGGAIFKPETPALFSVLGDDWKLYEKIYDPKTNVTKAQKQRVIEFAKFLQTANDADFAKGVGSYLDIDEFARYMAVNVWLVNTDSILAMGHNFYVYLHPETNKFQFMPWDLDLAFGHFAMGGTGLSILKPWLGTNKFLERVFQVEAFKTAYLARMAEFNKSLFVTSEISRRVDETAAAIREAVKEESEAKLAMFDQAAAGKDVVRTGEPGAAMMPMGSGTPIKGFLEPRSREVADQLMGKAATAAANGGPGMMFRAGEVAGMMITPAFMSSMDADKDASVSRAEFSAGFAKWFESWGGRESGSLTEEQIRGGLNKLLPAPPPR